MANPTPSSDDNAETFNLRTITMKMQEKMFSVMPSGILRLFLDEVSVRLFENICQLLRLYTGSAKLAMSYTKRIVKMNVRLAIFSESNLLTDEEEELTYDFHDRCHLAAEMVLRLGRPTHRLLPGVSPSRERLFQVVGEARVLALQITERQLSDRTREKFSEAMSCFTDVNFFEAIFGKTECYAVVMERVYDDIEDLMDRGLF